MLLIGLDFTFHFCRSSKQTFQVNLWINPPCSHFCVYNCENANFIDSRPVVSGGFVGRLQVLTLFLSVWIYAPDICGWAKKAQHCMYLCVCVCVLCVNVYLALSLHSFAGTFLFASRQRAEWMLLRGHTLIYVRGLFVAGREAYPAFFCHKCAHVDWSQTSKYNVELCDCMMQPFCGKLRKDFPPQLFMKIGCLWTGSVLVLELCLRRMMRKLTRRFILFNSAVLFSGVKLPVYTVHQSDKPFLIFC